MAHSGAVSSVLLTFDIGNTNIVVGVFQGEKLAAEFRLKTDMRRTVDEYGVLLGAFLQERFESRPDCCAAVISSVVPPLTPVMVRLVRDRFGVEPLIVGPGIKTGISIKSANPSGVGADRVVNAVAAKRFYGLPALVIDFGTATTFDYIDAKGNYLGGVILPGIEVAAEALVSNTAKLPRVELVWPESVLGRDTVGAMQSGTVIGYHCMIEGLIEKLLAEVGAVPHIIATGGLGSLMSRHSKRITAYDPHLVLRGMHYLVELNPPVKE
jgi:type III pantothenate kinase